MLWRHPVCFDPAPTGCGTPTYDVWYTLQRNNQSHYYFKSIGSNFTNARIQLLSGSCAGLAHQSCTVRPAWQHRPHDWNCLFYRVFSTGTVPSSNGTFNDCVTDPETTNDNCAGAVTLTSSATCTNIHGNTVGATLSASIPAPTGCGTPVYDVWYTFTAQTTNAYDHFKFHRQQFHQCTAYNYYPGPVQVLTCKLQ